MRIRSTVIAVALAGALAVFGCSTGSGTAAITPLSQPCEICLSGADAGVGCSAEFAACTRDSACDAAIRCELLDGCYEQPAGGSCGSGVGCKIGADASDAEQARAAFEQCARTKCAAACGFVGP